MSGKSGGRVIMTEGGPESAAVIVAHPDDETIWAGGSILMRPLCRWTIVALCRASDRDRSPRFVRALSHLGAETGCMGDLNDGPEQHGVEQAEIKENILRLLDTTTFNLILTHSLFGEYTRHRRHEEIGTAVLDLWLTGALRAKQLWMFAYDDTRTAGQPKAVKNAHRLVSLPESIWKEKQRIITEVYGFGHHQFEAIAAAKEEAFWIFSCPEDVPTWLSHQGGRA